MRLARGHGSADGRRDVAAGTRRSSPERHIGPTAIVCTGGTWTLRGGSQGPRRGSWSVGCSATREGFMMRSRRFIALVVVATALALTGVPGRADARGTPLHLDLRVGK